MKNDYKINEFNIKNIRDKAYKHKKFQYKNYYDNYENFYPKKKIESNNLPKINSKKKNDNNSKIYQLQKINNDHFSIDKFMEQQYKLHNFLNGNKNNNNKNKFKNLKINISKNNKKDQKLEPLSPKNIKNIKNFVKKWAKSPMNIIKKLRSPKRNIYYKNKIEPKKNNNVKLLNYDNIFNYGFKISYKTEYNSRFTEL